MRETSPRAGHKRNGSRVSLAARSRKRQAERTRATRRKLLDAAKRIFAQNGFEAARLEDIAVSAGYTRGAFYANFKSKEDIFFALLEEWVRDRIDTFTMALRCQNTPVKKLAALRKHYAAQATDRRLVLISLEFKLFALRHPEAHARLRSRHHRIRATFGRLLSELLPSLGKTLPISNPAASACLGSVAQGLLLEHMVDGKTLSESDVRHVLGLFFDSLFQAGPTDLDPGAAGHIA
ncbi:MAG TPA: TetR family transcriptional regulator [Candidatus Acidoferrales bacterium]|nr:TetR family transcriptional regulator [Candidatus Acidoferrales bacterium]